MFDVAVFEAGVLVQFDDFHFAAGTGDFVERAAIEQGEVGAGEAGVADDFNLFRGEAGQQAAADGVGAVEVEAETAGEVEGLDLGGGQADAFEQDEDPGGDGGFGLEKVGDVGFGDDEVGLAGAVGDAKRQAVIFPRDDAVVGVGDGVFLDASPVVEQAGLAADGEEIHVGGAAQTDGGAVADLVEFDGQRIGGDFDVRDGAVGGADAVGQSGAFEGGAGGGGAAVEFVATFEDDFAVGADIHEQGRSFVIDQAGSEGAGGEVGANVGSSAGQQMDGEAQFGKRRRKRQVGGAEDAMVEKGRGERRDADGRGIHTGKEVEHGGVGGDGQAADAVGRGAGFGDRLGDQRGEGVFNDEVLQMAQHGRVGRAEVDAGQHVVAEMHLFVEVGGAAEDLAGAQVGNEQGDGGGADVNGDAERLGVRLGSEAGDQPVVAVVFEGGVGRRVAGRARKGAPTEGGGEFDGATAVDGGEAAGGNRDLLPERVVGVRDFGFEIADDLRFVGEEGTRRDAEGDIAIVSEPVFAAADGVGAGNGFAGGGMDDLAGKQLDDAAIAETALAAAGVEGKMFAAEQFAEAERVLGCGDGQRLAPFGRLDDKVWGSSHVGPEYLHDLCQLAIGDWLWLETGGMAM